MFQPKVRAFWLILAGLLTACGAVTAPPPARRAVVETTSLPVCRPWTPSRCWVEVGASLHAGRSGRPLAGKRVRFVAGHAVLCDSVTDRFGHAECLGVAPNGRAIVENGYDVVFEGDSRFASARARAQPVRPR